MTTTTDLLFRVGCTERRGQDGRLLPVGSYATLTEGYDAAEKIGAAANIFEGFHLRAYTDGRGSRRVFPSQGYQFNGCPCGLCSPSKAVRS